MDVLFKGFRLIYSYIYHYNGTGSFTSHPQYMDLMNEIHACMIDRIVTFKDTAPLVLLRPLMVCVRSFDEHTVQETSKSAVFPRPLSLETILKLRPLLDHQSGVGEAAFQAIYWLIRLNFVVPREKSYSEELVAHMESLANQYLMHERKTMTVMMVFILFLVQRGTDEWGIVSILHVVIGVQVKQPFVWCLNWSFT